MERDANDPSSSEEGQPRPNVSVFTGRTRKPLFTSRNGRERIAFGRKTNGGDDISPIERKPTTLSGNWMSGRGMTLGEAFQRTDDNANFIPRPSLREGARGGFSDSRIPRTKTFSLPFDTSPSSSRSLKEIQNLPREKRAVSVPSGSGSECTGLRERSPSPAGRDRGSSRDGSGSDLSQNSPVEVSTINDIDGRIGEFANDQQRLRGLLSSQKALFARGSVGPRVEETTKTLARKTSASSLENDPPIRPPRTWGSKARKNANWMAKILSPDTSLELKAPLDIRPSHRQVLAADTPLPSIEDISSIQTLTPPASRPASAQLNDASPEKSQVWNADLDFTAQSLQISTSPQLRVKSSRLDDIRNREMESLTARAVASSRLEEIREKNSEERSILTDFVPGETQAEPEAKESLHEKTILEEEGEHITGTPITIFSGGSYESRNNHGSRERKTSHNREVGTVKSERSREDPRDLLRRLSRAASTSPGPPDPKRKEEEYSPKVGLSAKHNADEKSTALRSENTDREETEKLEAESEKPKEGSIEPKEELGKPIEKSSRTNALDVDMDIKRHSATSTPPKSDVDPEERITAEARLFDLQDNKSEKNSVRAPSRSPSPSDDGRFDETPMPKLDPLSIPTPKVTGAFIDTPAPTTRKPRKPRSISPSYQVVNVINDAVLSSESKDTEGVIGDRPRGNPQASRRLRRTSSHRDLAISQPHLVQPRPRTAILNTANPPSASEDLRRIQREAQIEDSTLDDFDAILEADAHVTTENQENTTIFEPVLDLQYDDQGLPLSQKEIARRIERLTLDRMSQSIKNTSSSIRDARHGIERLEHQVSSSVNIKEKTDETLYIQIPVPRLWTSSHPKQPGMSRNWKFTWLGFLLAIFFAWYIAESAMCAQFCHPTQSVSDTWSPSDPFFPWAIPTKLDQWTGEIASSAASRIWEILGGRPGPRWTHKSGPLGASDWWLGRNGPVGLVIDARDTGSFDSDEVI
jgi:hypothetical protein